jgi:hypothetical protein
LDAAEKAKEETEETESVDIEELKKAVRKKTLKHPQEIVENRKPQ